MSAQGTDGPIKVTLFEDPDGLTASAAEGCVRISEKLAKKLRRTPERFYAPRRIRGARSVLRRR